MRCFIVRRDAVRFCKNNEHMRECENEIDRNEKQEINASEEKVIAVHIELVVKFTRYGTLTATWVVNTTR